MAATRQALHLVETLRFEPAVGLRRLPRHMARLRSAAELMGFRFSNHRIGNLLQIAIGRLDDVYRVRVLLARDGSASVSVDALPLLSLPVPCRLAPYPSEDTLTDNWMNWAGGPMLTGVLDTPVRETLWVDSDGHLRHGTCTSLFLKVGERYLTPRSGLEAPWTILQDELVESGVAETADLTVDDLSAGELYLGNSLHGLMPAVLVGDDLNP